MTDVDLAVQICIGVALFFKFRRLPIFLKILFHNSHLIKGAIHEDQRNHAEQRSQSKLEALIVHAYGNFSCKKAKQGRELDDRIQ